MGRRAVVAGAVLFVVGGAALGYAVTRKAVGGMTPAKSLALGTAVASLDGDIKAARASVAQRAKTLGEINLVRDTIGTDAVTVKDQVGKEIAFTPEAGEVIELGQLPKPAGQAVVLVTLPDGGMRSSYAGKAGVFAELAGEQLYVTQTVEVIPSDATLAAEKTGYVTVSRRLDLTPAVKRLTDAGLSGRLEIGDRQLVIGSPPRAGAWTTEPVPSQPGAQLVAAVPPKHGGLPISIVGAGAGVAGLGLILLLIGVMTGKQGGVAAGGARPTTTTPGVGETQLAAPGVAAGTPSPVRPSGVSLGANPLGPGAVVGRWEIIRRLGSGGMADVFLAHARGEAGFQKLVAIKVMHAHLARNQRAVDHFLDEARLAARVTHPNVVAIQDLGKIGDDYVIVMDYVEGVDLEQLLAAARDAGRVVPVNVGLGILCRICDGLHAAHTATSPDGTPLGIIHRDVKSANVLVSKQGGVKVVDFGIAKAATQGHNTVAGETKGTPSMMAPEQRVGEQVDVRADVYAVAAVAFEVLTGHAVNLDLAALAHLGIENWPHLPRPTSLRELPPELDALLLTAMSYDRARRPESCAAFEAMLETVMKTHNLTASDKDIARWAESELRAFGVGAPAAQSRSTPVGLG